ncbi:hypothetical protein F5888DRAFT_1739931 [Russula emetica]|nr:hypothetical protein F5888DRAFT_1739931 [Russula emetica]
MKKSKKHSVEERAPIIGAFVTSRVLQLTGEVPTIVSFFRCITSPLTHLDLVIEDPFDKIDGGALCLNDIVRATSRGEIVSHWLSL